MRVSTRFPIAVHALILMAFSDCKITSEYVAGSTGVNAVIIRNIFSKLKKADIISIAPGPGGTQLNKPAEEINLWDIYRAVETDNTDDMFKFHANSSEECPIGSNIYGLLKTHLNDTVLAMKRELSAVTLSGLLTELHEKL